MLLRRARNDKPRASAAVLRRERWESGGAFRLPRIDVRPRECKCEIVVDPFFPALIAPHCLRSTFLSPSHASPSISAFRSSSLPLLLWPLLRLISRARASLADKLISSGKSSSDWRTFPPTSVLHPLLKIRARNPAPEISSLVFSCLSSRERVTISPFAFCFPSTAEKVALTFSLLVRIKLRF